MRLWLSPKSLYWALLASFLSHSLSGCFKAELNGPIEGSTIEVRHYNPDSQAPPYFSTTGLSTAAYEAVFGVDGWNQNTDAAQLNLLGWGVVRETQVIPSEYYLAESVGGQAVDLNGDSVVDAQPTPLAGSLHGYLTGEQMRSTRARLNPVTEAIFQHMSGAADMYYPLSPQLDKFAQRYVSDLNEDGQIGYEDLFELTAGNFPAGNFPNKAAWDAMIEAVIADDQDALTVASFELLGMNKASFDQITDEVLYTCARATGETDLPAIRNLLCTFGSASSLEGIEQMQNLEHLDLSFLRLFSQDVEALGALTQLRTLILDDNNLSGGGAFLQSLVNLETLSLNDTNFDRLSNVAGLSKLTELNLNGSSFRSFSGTGALTSLASLTSLRTLNMEDVSVNDFFQDEEGVTQTRSNYSPLAEMTWLRELDLSGSSVESHDFLYGLTGLESLEVGRAASSANALDIAQLSALRNLAHLSIRGTGVDNLSALSELNALRSLILSIWDLESLAALTGLPPLRSLDMEITYPSDSVPDWGFFDQQAQLAELELTVSEQESFPGGGGLISPATFDLWNLSTNTALEQLLVNANVENLNALVGLTGITALNLRGTDISDLSPLSGMTSMVSLILSDSTRGAGGTGPLNLAPLSQMVLLESLSLTVGAPADISVLRNFQQLEELTIALGEVEDFAPLFELPNLRRLQPIIADTTSETGAAACAALAELALQRPYLSFSSSAGCP